MWNLVEGTWSTIGATAIHPHHPHLSSVFCTVVVLKARMLFGGICSCRSLFIALVESRTIFNINETKCISLPQCGLGLSNSGPGSTHPPLEAGLQFHWDSDT